MLRRPVLLAVAAAALAAGPASAAAPPGGGLVTDESIDCGTVVHSGGNSAYIDGQHYIASRFEFSFGEFTDTKEMGRKKGFTGDALVCTFEEEGGTVTVTLLPV